VLSPNGRKNTNVSKPIHVDTQIEWWLSPSVQPECTDANWRVHAYASGTHTLCYK